jgi:protein-tyrosine kinase
VSIIEQAARRLEELGRAGIQPASLSEVVAPRSAGAPAADSDKGATALHAAPEPAKEGRPGAQARHKAQEGIHSVEIDLARMAANGFLTPNLPRSRVADEFRGAKHGLLVNVRGKSAAPVKRANCIMVTSAVPGEGKTFTAVNLAMSLAMEVDLRLLLVDADVLNPSVPDRLGLPSSKGLLDLLTEPGLSLADVILRTNVDKLSILPAGTASGHATELLASGAMTRLIDDLASYDPSRIILFDAPPLLAAPETRQLAAHVGQIVVVVQAQRTPRNAVADALELIKDYPVVMTLLNKVRAGARAGYGYGSSYRSVAK